jgi:hypothetical protein
VPPGPVAVAVYVVVAAGFMTAVPFGKAHGPHTLLSIVRLVTPPLVCQARFADWPWPMLVGLTVKSSFVDVSVTVAVAVAVALLALVAVRV